MWTLVHRSTIFADKNVQPRFPSPCAVLAPYPSPCRSNGPVTGGGGAKPLWQPNVFLYEAKG